MMFGHFPDVAEDEGEADLDPEDVLTLEAVGNAQHILDAQWISAPPWVLAGCGSELAVAQMPIWRAWIRTVRSAQIEAENYHNRQRG